LNKPSSLATHTHTHTHTHNLCWSDQLLLLSHFSMADRVADAQNRMRILEEDRDILSAQSVKLQRMLDSEREERHAAQKAQLSAVEKLRELAGTPLVRRKLSVQSTSLSLPHSGQHTNSSSLSLSLRPTRRVPGECFATI
jgi:hypothetical protein